MAKFNFELECNFWICTNTYSLKKNDGIQSSYQILRDENLKINYYWADVEHLNHLKDPDALNCTYFNSFMVNMRLSQHVQQQSVQWIKLGVCQCISSIRVDLFS